MKKIAFIDSEIGIRDHKIKDIGIIDCDGNKFHENDASKLQKHILKSDYVCGHNLIDHDFKYLKNYIYSFFHKPRLVDTLFISPILFPKKPYHKLLKDDKIYSEDLNNPLNDAIKAKELFENEVTVFNELDNSLKRIYTSLLYDDEHFKGFLDYVDAEKSKNVIEEIKTYAKEEICANANISKYLKDNSVALAYVIATILTQEKQSIIPAWVQKNYPIVDNIISELRGTPCKEGCEYCNKKFNSTRRLQEIFGYPGFRTFEGDNLQEKAVDAAINHDSILTIFPTGGGKSITFQLPALIAGETNKSLTIVISPLQSLMKDQVDNLSDKGIIDAVTINGMLDPVSRTEAVERVIDGRASLLYISPETLRSKTLERMLMCRNIERIVIDEAHCFSSWGQDFRVDYLYIADFIKNLEEKKGNGKKIPISCFTATAKPKVISDIKDYFREKLGVELTLYATASARKNLQYHVIKTGSDDEKYQRLRELIEAKNCPTIVYVSRTRSTVNIAEKLRQDGFEALPYNGKMESKEKQTNQESFKKNETQIMVATSAFGMGVDKDDVGLVVHFEISDSLENYVQEAGRAGRNQAMNADCYVLYNDDDLNKHFLLLNQTKLSCADIQHVWKGIKELTANRKTISCSALEIARKAGWDDTVQDIETRVRTAISALESAGFVSRGQNSPRVFATSVRVKSFIEASNLIDQKKNAFDEGEIEPAKRIIQRIISAKSHADAGTEEAESRVDYLADTLSLEKGVVLSCLDKLKQIGVLADEQDMNAYIKKNESKGKTEKFLSDINSLEEFMVSKLEQDKDVIINIKEFTNEAINDKGIKCAKEKTIKTILYFWKIKGYIKNHLKVTGNTIRITPLLHKNVIENKIKLRNKITYEILNCLYDKAHFEYGKEEALVNFSMKELMDYYNNSLLAEIKAEYKDIQDALLFLNKMSIISLEGGFLVLYNALSLTKIVDNKVQYRKANYKQLDEFYSMKTQQIHIVGKYANMMCDDIEAALTFVSDYFNMEYNLFLGKYFKGKTNEIKKNITAAKYNAIFGDLSEVQTNIIEDKSQYISVIAGPGSGKTRVLVHKLASLLLLEDTKQEQLLMLTFSRAAATEFKQRLRSLIGSSADYVDIKTFHSFCFDLLDKFGNEEEFENVIPAAIQRIRDNDAVEGKITKTVLVIDEAQDMDENEFNLVEELLRYNEDMRVIAVGDDDQNIYEFRGSDSKYMRDFTERYSATTYEMNQNYRSTAQVVDFSNSISRKIKRRLKNKPIVSMRKDNGNVVLYKHNNQYMEQAIVDSIVKNKAKAGKTAILTRTNDEALQIMGLLRKNGVPAKLIQDNNQFRLSNLLEVRDILDEISKDNESPVFSDTRWNSLVDYIVNKYEKSTNKDIVVRLLEQYSQTYPKMHVSDLVDFIIESQIEDFIVARDDEVVVSTIHKSKGKEFDTVYIMLNEYKLNNDEQIRDLYVGITRAKNNLIIHYYGNTLDEYDGDSAVLFSHCKQAGEELKEIEMSLTHRDIYLGAFKKDYVQNSINNLFAGKRIFFNEDGLYADENYKKKVVYFSTSFKDRLNRLYERGFRISSAKVNYMVYWRDKMEVDSPEVKLVLPCIQLIKSEEPITQENNPCVFDEPMEVIEKVVQAPKEEKTKKEVSLVEKYEKDGFRLIYNENGECITDCEVLGKIRQLRAILAKEQDVSAFVILTNDNLVQLATYKPTNQQQFEGLKGLGPYKYQKYGMLFIERIHSK